MTSFFVFCVQEKIDVTGAQGTCALQSPCVPFLLSNCKLRMCQSKAKGPPNSCHAFDHLQARMEEYNDIQRLLTKAQYKFNELERKRKWDDEEIRWKREDAARFINEMEQKSLENIAAREAVLNQEERRFREEKEKEKEKIVDQQLRSSKKIKLDVGGVHYSTSITTLTSHPNSMLAAMFSGRFSLEKDEDGCFFIDRDGRLFGIILSWLRTGVLSYTEHADLIALKEEAKYFQLEEMNAQIGEEERGSNTTPHLSPLEFVTLVDKKRLSGLDLRPFCLKFGDFRGVSMVGCNLAGMDLRQVDFSGCNLCEADLSGANLSSANLSSANLSSANLSSTNLTSANLSNAKLKLANLSSANLSSSNLSSAKLSGANLSYANLNHVEFKGANLSYADLRKSTHGYQPPNFISANLFDADLTDSQLTRSHLSGAHNVRLRN